MTSYLKANHIRDELGNDFSTRIEGTRIRHHMGPASIKMYDKFGLVLRIETRLAEERSILRYLSTGRISALGSLGINRCYSFDQPWSLAV